MRLKQTALATIAAYAVFAGPVQAQSSAPVPSPEATPAPAAQMSKIILIGDSTTATGNGWGSMFCAHHVTQVTACLNLARNGRSSGSYRREGLWNIALQEMQVAPYSNVYVIIGFGHNDQPGKPGRSTDLEREFPANMRRYVEEIQAQGAVPILFTPLTRRSFGDGEVVSDLDPWARAIRQIASETGIPVIDLNARSETIVQALGPSVQNLLAEAPPSPEVAAAAAIDGVTLPSKTGRPFLPEAPKDLRIAKSGSLFDYTHLGEFGGKLFAAVMADELASADPQLAKLIVP